MHASHMDFEELDMIHDRVEDRTCCNICLRNKMKFKGNGMSLQPVSVDTEFSVATTGAFNVGW